MITNILLLFKKDLSQSVLSTFKRKHGERDLFGIIATFLLLLVLYGTFIFVFNGFAKSYLSAIFEDSNAVNARTYELLTMVFSVVLIINILVGIKNIHSALLESKDVEVLLCQPISSGELFAYKLIKIYFSQIISSLLVLIPSSIVLDNLTYLGGVGYYAVIIGEVLLLPLVSCAIASLLAIPFNYISRFISQHFILHLISYVLLLLVGFSLYGVFLKELTYLVSSGKLTMVFDIITVTKIGEICSKLYPINFFSNLLVGKSIATSILFLLLIGVIGFVIAGLIIKSMYNVILQKRMEGTVKYYGKKTKYKMRNPVWSLIYKEFLVVLRTPSYAFQYFATAFTLPVMVYICVNLMQDMMKTLTFVNCDFEIAVFTISAFAVLTNTFCTTNISRDGKMYGMLRTLPVSGKTVVWSKVIFCSIISIASVLASVITLLAVGYLSWWQALTLFFSASILSFAEIAFSTRKDLNKPHLPESDKDEVEEGNSTVSSLIFLGLITSIITGGGAVAISIVLSLLGTSIQVVLASAGLVVGISVIVFVFSLIYIIKGLNEQYYSSEV